MELDYVKKVSEIVIALDKTQTNQSVAHRLDHIRRVLSWKTFISQKLIASGEKVDLEILDIAVWLHDIRQPHNEEKSLHVAGSATKAREILESINYPEDRIQRVLKAISQHSSEVINAPDTIEAKILYDADKLDGFGATGIVRVFMLCGQLGISVAEAVEWYIRKIAKAIPFLQTEIAKQIVREKEEYVNSFFEQFKREQEFLEAI